MGKGLHSSMYIAPLQIRKENSQATTSVTQPSERKPAEMSSDDVGQEPQNPHTNLGFTNYLRAFYPFHPDYDDSSSTITLPLNYGDVILIHSIHTNGWADGTLLASGARGWLPTNYCEVYDSQPIGTLLKGLISFWDLVRSASGGASEVLGGQDYVGGLIAGVRCLLVCWPRVVRSVQGIAFTDLICSGTHQLPEPRFIDRAIPQRLAQES